MSEAFDEWLKGSSETKCRGCGTPVVWITAKSADGTKDVKIPLDPRAPVYEVDPVNPTRGERTKSAMVSHFKTCPKANQF